MCFCGCCFTSFPYLQQGGRGDLQSSAQRSSLQASQEARTDHPCVPARLWSPGVQGLLPFSFNFISFWCRHGHRLSPEPARRFISCLFITALWSQFVMVGTIWLSWTEVSASNSLHLALAMAMVLFDTFSGLFTDPFLSGIIGVLFACKMNSTSEFAKIVLSKCVTHAGFVMVAWTLRGIPFQVGIWILDLISEFTFFNLVIRLSKVQQLAIFRFSPCRLSTCWTTARCSRDSPFSLDIHSA